MSNDSQPAVSENDFVSLRDMFEQYRFDPFSDDNPWIDDELNRIEDVDDDIDIIRQEEIAYERHLDELVREDWDREQGLYGLTPKERLAELDRRHVAYIKNYEAGHSSLGDILGEALRKKAAKK